MKRQLIFIISPSFCSIGIWDRGVCNLVLLNCSQDIGWGISHVIESLTGSGRNPFQSHCPCGCWLEASAFHHTYFSQGLLECLHNTGGGFAQSEWCKREQRGSHSVFNDPAWEDTLHHFHSIMWVTHVSPIQGRRGHTRA